MPPIFEGHFERFTDIPSANQYDDLNFIETLYRNACTRYQTSGPFPAPLQNEYNHIRDITSLCVTLLCAESRDHILNVLDVGGGFGVSCIELMHRCQLPNFNYTIYEINNFITCYHSKPFFQEKNIRLISKLSEITESQNLIIFGSSLQYFPDTNETLNQIIATTKFPSYILITHTPVTYLPSFATLQVNMDNKKIPNWIFNIDTLKNIFLKCGYTCIFQSAVFRQGLFDDFKDNDTQFRSANLLFKKSI
ncbi:MAG: hypothetical protein A3I77_04320 [Gammaproteobacteria bacterium RIFCSPLOWO2_02_FULL_42_14]|nr:MAG: hypothetical protein A3E54_05385 [Gammaproteobacteria bacterium RIFCSPHIGHO2_12_FULL_41_25]OGT62172.1 MAG: hypothetical protein A3I77_04320 [Gammaproteobacteria bacterium RIFCSPLOWO2_02_FULL_42_14]OGT85845.1 MAG: hypothetical protein A3G86_04010 [Gammaproteobacteria bacterium RIFCSPLOWO2_12_FULL_42_18]